MDALLQTGWEGGPESFLFSAADGKLLPAAAGPQSALCAARPHLKAADKARVVCDKVPFKGTISCRSLQHAVPPEWGRKERVKARGTCPSLAPDLIICIPSTHSKPGWKLKGFFHLPKMGCILPSLPAAKMTLKRSRKGAKICIQEAASASACISSPTTLLPWVMREAPGRIPQVPLKYSCTLPTCTHGMHGLRQQGRMAVQSATLTATCSPLSLIVDMRENSPFAFHAGEANLFPPETAKTSSPLSGPLALCVPKHSQTLAKHSNLLHWKVRNPGHGIPGNAAR